MTTITRERDWEGDGMNWSEAIQQLHNEPVTRGELSKADGRTLGGARVEPTMPLRDYFAAKAPIDFAFVCSVAGSDQMNIGDDKTRATLFAVWTLLRYEWADAMLAERAKP